MLIEDTGLRCLRCGYNLTGLSSRRCPECGTSIDWNAVRTAALDPEVRRPGTPAHRARGVAVIPATVRTILLMLFLPWRFAAMLRTDESIVPSLCTAALSFAVFLVHGIHSSTRFTLIDFLETMPVACAIGSTILVQSFVFSVLGMGSSRRYAGQTLRKRFRWWILASLYATCFVAGWPLAGELPVMFGLTGANFYWPLARRGPFSMSPQIGTTIIMYWWWAVLLVLLWIRLRPRWLVILSLPVLPLIAAMASWLGEVTFIQLRSILR